MNEDVSLEHRLTAVEARSSSNTKRIDAVEENQKILTDLASGVKVMGTKLDTLSSSVNKLDSKVDILEQKPAKRYENLVTNAIWAVIAACITYILTHIGL